MGKLLENATKIASLAALAIYGIVRVGIDAFYGRLGIPAEDVGITQATIVSRAAVSFFIAIILTAMLAAVLTAPMTSWTRRRLEKGRSSGTQPGHSTPVVDTPNLENFSYVVAWLSLFVFGAALLFSRLLDRAEFFPISGPIVTGPVAVLITTAVMLTLTLPALNAYVGMAREDPDRAEARIRSLMWVHGVVATLIGTLALQCQLLLR